MADLGEREFIRRFILPLTSCRLGNIPLDDCAVLSVGQETLLFSVDQGPARTFLELLGVGSPEDIGHFHVTVNASDIAAMGGKPIGMLLVLAMQKETKLEFVSQLMEGVRQGMEEYGIQLFGGDTKQAAVNRITITVIGQATNGRVLKRLGAHVGDQIFVTPGKIGACISSYVHAALLKQSGKSSPKVSRPRAQLEFGLRLAESGIVTSCMDMSDGILAAIDQLGEINGMRFNLNFDSMPVATSPCPDRQQEWRQLVLNVGGDFGLLFTTSRSDAYIAEDLGGQWIGEITSATRNKPSNRTTKGAASARPWEHFNTVDSTSDAILSFVRQ